MRGDGEARAGRGRVGRVRLQRVPGGAQERLGGGGRVHVRVSVVSVAAGRRAGRRRRNPGGPRGCFPAGTRRDSNGNGPPVDDDVRERHERVERGVLAKVERPGGGPGGGSRSGAPGAGAGGGGGPSPRRPGPRSVAIRAQDQRRQRDGILLLLHHVEEHRGDVGRDGETLQPGALRASHHLDAGGDGAGDEPAELEVLARRPRGERGGPSPRARARARPPRDGRGGVLDGVRGRVGVHAASSSGGAGGFREKRARRLRRRRGRRGKPRHPRARLPRRRRGGIQRAARREVRAGERGGVATNTLRRRRRRHAENPQEMPEGRSPGTPRPVRPDRRARRRRRRRERRRRRRPRRNRFRFRFRGRTIDDVRGRLRVERRAASTNAVRRGEHPDDGGEFRRGKVERGRGEKSRGVHLRLRETFRADEVRVPGERVERVYAVQPRRRRGLPFPPRVRQVVVGAVRPGVVFGFAFFTAARVVANPGWRGGCVSPRGVYRQQRLRIGQHRQRGATRLFRQSREPGGVVVVLGRVAARSSRGGGSRRLLQPRDATPNRAKHLEQQAQGGVSHETGGVLQTPGESRFREGGRDGGSDDGETLRLAGGGVRGRDRRGRVETRRRRNLTEDHRRREPRHGRARVERVRGVGEVHRGELRASVARREEKLGVATTLRRAKLAEEANQSRAALTHAARGPRDGRRTDPSRAHTRPRPGPGARPRHRPGGVGGFSRAATGPVGSFPSA